MANSKPENEQEAVVLSGGNSNAQVLRVGQTVRRIASSATKTVHRLLDHVRANGFLACPEPMGFDEKGREVLSYIEGDTGIPESIWLGDEAMLSSVTLLRTFHDASQNFARTDTQCWGIEPGVLINQPLLDDAVGNDNAVDEVICHNDFAPYNFVFKNNRTIAVFDFDLCSPGQRITDFAYLAYWMVPLSFSADDMQTHTLADIANNSQRLKKLCASYPMSFDTHLIDHVERALYKMADEPFARKVLGDVVAQKLVDEGHLAHWRKELIGFQENRHLLEANIDTV